VAARKAPFLRAYPWSTEKLDNLGLQPPQYNLGIAGAYQLIRVFLSWIENLRIPT